MPRKSYLKTAVAIVVLLFVVSRSNAASLQPIGHLEGGTTYGVPHSVSANGFVVVGHGVSAFGREAYRWENGVMIGLGDLPGGVFSSEAYDVSADGSVVVGVSAAASGKEAFRWENGVITGLGDLPGGEFLSNAMAVSADGLVIVGASNSATGYQALRWENGIMKGLGYLAGGAFSRAMGISADGSVIVGQSDSSYGRVAFRWENGTMMGLGDLPGGSVWSIATDVSDDGSVVVGASFSASGREAIRWTASTGMVALGVLPDGYYNSSAYAVSADGSVVVGISGDRAFIWNQINGMRNLKELLEGKYRLDLTGWSLYSATGVSADGLTIVGEGCGPEGCEDWIAVLSKPEPTIIYVDSDAPQGGDGMSWEDACKYLQDALAAAWPGDEIRVAQGIYKPDQGDGQTPGDREATFQLINGVSLKGGYAGFGEPDPNAHDINLYETILSGDLNGDDGPNFSNNEENSYQVVTAISVGSPTVLDGLIITAGNANHQYYLSMKISGGGMYMLYSSPKITDCIFTSNSAAYGGAGLYNYKGDPVLTNCTFHSNLATSHPHFGGSGYGAGMRNSTGSPILTNCVFSNNHAKGRYPGDSGGISGGLHCYVETSNDLEKGPILIDCVFINNTAQSAAGGMCPGIGNTILINCIFTRNYAEDGGAMASAPRMMANCLLFDNSAEYGGAMYLCEDKNNLIKNCTFVANSATFIGGIVDCEDSIANLTNCILFNNTSSGVADEQAQIYLPDGATVLNYNCIQGWTGDLGGIGNIGDNPLFVDPNNHDYHLLPASPCIDTGDPNYPYDPNETDLDGKPRIINGRIDMGAYEHRPPILADLKIVPRTINMASKGKWLAAFIRLPEQYNIVDIDPDSILLEDEIKPEQFSVDEQSQVAIARFNRKDVQPILEVGDIELTITGRLTDGTAFEAADKVKIINKVGKN